MTSCPRPTLTPSSRWRTAVFVHHHGVDPLPIARALWADLRTRSLAEGGSTITQQLAKNELFTQEKQMARRAAEMFAALAIEKQYNKEQIF